MRELQIEELENINGGDLKTDSVQGSIGGTAATGATFGMTFGPLGILAGAGLGGDTGAFY